MLIVNEFPESYGWWINAKKSIFLIIKEIRNLTELVTPGDMIAAPGRLSGEPATCNFVVLLAYMWGDHYMEQHNNGPGGIRTHDHLRFLCHGMQGRYSTGLNHRPSTLSFADDILIFYFKLPTNLRKQEKTSLDDGHG